MSDSVESMKAAAELEKQRRRESWEQRHVAIAAIRELGYGVQAMGTAEMHFRIKLPPGAGFVDFWPSTWRWHHKRKGQMRPAHAGNGLKAMLEYLRGPITIIDQPGARVAFVPETRFGTTPQR